MKGWSNTQLCESKAAIAVLAALLLLAVTLAPVSASPLTISSVASGNVTDTSATITWTTDEPADSVVNYGNTTALGSAVSDSALVTDHAIGLTSLAPATLYYYEVSSTNAGGNTTVDNNGGAYYTFTTTDVPDTTPPVISGVQATNIALTSATIIWTTDDAADSVVNYGNTTALGSTVSDSALVTDHAIGLTSLAPATLYYYEVSSTNAGGNTTVDNNGGAYYTFTTADVPDTTPPVISGVQATNIALTLATIIWTTDDSANSVVNYGNTIALGSTESDSALVTDHAIGLTSLAPATLYYYEVSSTNAGGNTTVDNNGGAYYTFTTTDVPDTTPPVISGVQATNIALTSATIIWTTDDAADSVVNYGNTTALGSTESDSALVTDHAIGLTSLAPATLYYYEVSSTNAGGNTTVDNNGGAYYTFTTADVPDTTPPTISGVQATDITPTSATIIWTTDEPADSVVNYGNTTALGRTASDASLVTTHMASLGSLDPATTYYYEVQSTDGVGNTASDNNGGLYYTFTTSDIPPPVITGVQAIPITATSAVITWTTDKPATSVVNYGNTIALGLTASDASLVTSHSITLSGLLLGTTYYYEVQSTDEGGKTATDNNEGAYYTLTIYRLTGWGWCTDYTEIANAEFVANGILVPRAGAPESSALHLVGNVTLTLSDSTTESIALDMYGSKVRSLFYGHQEEKGKSASLQGVWLTWDGGQYLSAWGRITLPQGEVFKTAKLYLLQLRTPGVEIPESEPDGFVADLEYLITLFAKFIDGLIDKLMVTDFADILGSVLAKTMVLLAAVRELGVPYIR